ncbi:MAG: hypothetical protein WBB45_03000 [Cyclobacteriaceae bacterium]
MKSIRLFNLFKTTACGLAIIAGVASTGCEVDDFTEEITNTDDPTLTLVNQADTINIEANTELRFAVEDQAPGLSYFQADIKNADGIVVYGMAEKLTGTMDTIVFKIDQDTLDVGQYTMEAMVEDTEGRSSSFAGTFYGDVFGNPIPVANQDAMFIQGSMNSWGGFEQRMTLVSDYTWQYTFTISATDEFKFANTFDWSGQDWTDTDCDGVVEDGAGQGNIACGYEGDVLVTFNDETLEYSVDPLVSNEDQMFIMGDMNGWSGGDLEMSLVGSYTWEITGVTIEAGNQFKFASKSDWSGRDWGDAACDGVAEEATGGGANTNCNFEGTYTVRFNDETFAYELIEE